MFIIIFENSDKKKRVFIKKTRKSANKMVEEMEVSGWDFCSMEEVDFIMYETLKIKLN